MDRIFAEEERRIDLASIRKIDTNISHVLDKTDNVAFYKFDGKVWHKQDIHGSIFVFSRSECPYYGFTILNRRSLSDNVLELLEEGLEFQRCDLYLLYKTGHRPPETGIKSIWFEDEAGCMRISTLLHRLLRQRNEPPAKTGNILEKTRVRQSRDSPPEAAASPDHSPPHRRNKRASLGEYRGGYSNYRSQHDYRTNSKSESEKGTGYRTNSKSESEKGPGGFRSGGRPHIKHQEKSCQGQRKQEKNILSMFSQARQRYNTHHTSNTCPSLNTSPSNTSPNSKVTIMKRSKSELPGVGESIIVPPGIIGVSRSRSSDSTLIKEEKDVKTIPITFQDLVNSVQPKSEERPLSCYSIEGSSSSSAEDIAVSSGECDQYHNSPPSSNSDLAHPLPALTSNLSISQSENLTDFTCPTLTERAKSSDNLAQSAQLLMSPLDFQRRRNVETTPAKRMLFSKLGREDTPTQKLDMDLDQFKRLLIKALKEDDAFLGSLFEIFQKKVSNTR